MRSSLMDHSSLAAVIGRFVVALLVTVAISSSIIGVRGGRTLVSLPCNKSSVWLNKSFASSDVRFSNCIHKNLTIVFTSLGDSSLTLTGVQVMAVIFTGTSLVNTSLTITGSTIATLNSSMVALDISGPSPTNVIIRISQSVIQSLNAPAVQVRWDTDATLMVFDVQGSEISNLNATTSFNAVYVSALRWYKWFVSFVNTQVVVAVAQSRVGNGSSATSPAVTTNATTNTSGNATGTNITTAGNATNMSALIRIPAILFTSMASIMQDGTIQVSNTTVQWVGNMSAVNASINTVCWGFQSDLFNVTGSIYRLQCLGAGGALLVFGSLSTSNIAIASSTWTLSNRSGAGVAPVSLEGGMNRSSFSLSDVTVMWFSNQWSVIESVSSGWNASNITITCSTLHLTILQLACSNSSGGPSLLRVPLSQSRAVRMYLGHNRFSATVVGCINSSSLVTSSSSLSSATVFNGLYLRSSTSVTDLSVIVVATRFWVHSNVYNITGRFLQVDPPPSTQTTMNTSSVVFRCLLLSPWYGSGWYRAINISDDVGNNTAIAMSALRVAFLPDQSCTGGDDDYRCFPSLSESYSLSGSAPRTHTNSITLSPRPTMSPTVSSTPSRGTPSPSFNASNTISPSDAFSASKSSSEFSNVTAVVIAPLAWISADDMVYLDQHILVMLIGTWFNRFTTNTTLCKSITFDAEYTMNWTVQQQQQQQQDQQGNSTSNINPVSSLNLHQLATVMEVGSYFSINGSVVQRTPLLLEWHVPSSGNVFRGVTRDITLWFRFERLCLARADVDVRFQIVVRRLQPLLFAPSMVESVVQDVALPVAVLGGSVWLAAEVSRVTLPYRVLRCNPIRGGPLEHFQSPVGWNLYDADYGYYVGLLAVNGSIWFGTLLLHLMSVLVYWLATQTTFVRGAIAMRFPSLWIVPVFGLLQPTSMASVMLVRQLGPPWEVFIIGLSGCVVCVGVCLVMVLRHVCYFQSVYHADAYLGLRSVVGGWLLGLGRWEDSADLEVLQYSRRHWLWFGDTIQGFHWVFVLELLTQILLGVAEGLSLGEGNCVPHLYAIAVLFLLRTAFYVFCRPFDNVLLNVSLSGLAALETLMCAAIITHEVLDVVNVTTRAKVVDVASWAGHVAVYMLITVSALELVRSALKLGCTPQVPTLAEQQRDQRRRMLSALVNEHAMNRGSADGEEPNRQIVSLLEKVADEVESNLSKYDSHIIKELVSVHLELLMLPGSERDAERALLRVLREIDIFALEQHTKELFTPTMSELYDLLELRSRDSVVMDSSVAVDVSAIEMDVVKTPNQERSPPQHDALTSLTFQDKDADLGPHGKPVVTNHARGGRQRILDDILQDNDAQQV